MTDPHAWQPPTGGPRSDGPAAPAPSPVAGPPAGGPSASGPWPAPAPPAAPRAPGGWTRPTSPGIVPLRPLTVGEILGGAFTVLRRNPRTTFGTALLAQVVVLVVAVVVTGGVAALAFLRVDSVLPEDREAATAGAVAVTVAAALVPLALSLVVSALLQGLFALETSHQVLGRRLRLGGLWRLARGRLAALVGWTALLALASVLVTAVIVGVVVLGVVLGGEVGGVVAVLVALVLGLGAAVLAAWVLTKTAFVPSVIVLERAPVAAAVRRSWGLTRGGFWRTFGILLLVLVMIQVAAQVVTAPFSFLTPVVLGLFLPTGTEDPTVAIVVTAALYLVTVIVASVVGAVGSVVQTASTALLYVDLRIRREGLDLELARHVELREAGATDLPDPYRTPEAGPAGASWASGGADRPGAPGAPGRR